MANRSKYGVDVSPKGKEKRTYKGITFRSLLEKDWAIHLDSSPNVAKWEYEPHRFDLCANGVQVCTYRPDFLVTLKDGSEEWHEVKGRVDSAWSLKLRLLKATLLLYNPNLTLYVITKPRGMDWQKKPVKPATVAIPVTS